LPLLSKLNRHARRWRQLSDEERRFIRVITPKLLAIWLALRLFAFRKVVNFVENARISPVTPLPTDSDLWRYAELTRATANLCLPGESCLPQALALGWQLRRMGVYAGISIGAAGSGDQFRAHAWIEVNGMRFDPSRLPYKSLYRSADTFAPLANRK
jgi:hypothetical protein